MLINLLFVCSLLASCISKRIVEISYFNEGIELNTNNDPKSFLYKFKRIKADVVWVSPQTFDSIWYGDTPTKKDKEWTPEPRFCIKKGTKKYFLNSFDDAFTNNYDSVVVSHETIYLIRKVSGYYNRIELEDLQNMIEIKEFGVPKDYKYSPSKIGIFGRKVILKQTK